MTETFGSVTLKIEMPLIIAILAAIALAGASFFGLGPTGEKLIPDIPTPVGGNVACIPADVSSGTVVLDGLEIPKPDETNVPFVGKPDPLGRFACGGKGGCTINPWDGSTYPDKAAYVIAVSNVRISNIWPDDNTTRLVKQKLPPEDPRYPDNSKYNEIRDYVYRATCNDWCAFVPPRRDPALPYGGTFFCDFIFFLHQDQPLKERNVDGVMELYPDDSECDLKNNPEKCPLFDILIRKDAPSPESAGGAAPGKEITPIRCDLITPTPGASQNFFPLQEFADKLQQAVFAQGETFIYIDGENWIYEDEFSAYKFKLNDSRERLNQADDSPREFIFRNEKYWAYTNLVKEFGEDLSDFLFLVGFEPSTGKNYLEVAEDPATAFDYQFPYLRFRRSPKVRPKAKTLQLGTFQVPTTSGWWELFVEESKPAIYLYPEKPTKLRVKLNPAGKLTTVDPPYDPEKGWEVIAYPDGTLKNLSGKDTSDLPAGKAGVTRSESEGAPRTVEESSYPYLFYEAALEKVFIKPEGFIVEGKNLVQFFKNTLPKLGLNQKETQDFIDYWMTRLNENEPYYLIHFLDEDQIESLEPLTIEKLNSDSCATSYKLEATGSSSDPWATSYRLQVTSSIRIRAYFKPLEKPVEIKAQTLPQPPKRQGFTLVEWGGILDK